MHALTVTDVVSEKCSRACSSTFLFALNKGAQYADLQVEHPVCSSTDPFPLLSISAALHSAHRIHLYTLQIEGTFVSENNKGKGVIVNWMIIHSAYTFV